MMLFRQAPLTEFQNRKWKHGLFVNIGHNSLQSNTNEKSWPLSGLVISTDVQQGSPHEQSQKSSSRTCGRTSKNLKDLSLLFFIGRKDTSEGTRWNRVSVAPPLNHTCESQVCHKLACKLGDAVVPNHSDSWKDSSFRQDLLLHP